MSLFDEASLIVTPNAYKEGKIYAIKPTDGSGDLSVVRATTATDVNSAGLIEDTPYNLFQRSEEFNNAVWIKATSTISPNVTNAPNGTLTADKLIENSSIGGSYFVQQSAQGNINSVSIYAKADTRSKLNIFYTAHNSNATFDLIAGTVFSTSGTISASIESVGNGWYRCIASTTLTTHSSIRFYLANDAGSVVYNGNGTSGLFLWGAQLVTGSSAREYFPTTDRLNVPRLDYTNSTCPSILVEPQRTNLVTFSEQFDNAIWVKTGTTITSNTTNSPSGTLTSDTLVGDGLIGVHILGFNATSPTGVTTISVFAKKNTNNFIQIIGSAISFGTNVWANFDLNNGTLGTIGSATTARIENFGNGWYRCTITGTSTSASSPAFNIGLITSATSTRAEASTLNTSVFIWGAQMELGSNATSYIPTVASTVTRNADVISKTGISSLIGQTEGTLFVDVNYEAEGIQKNYLNLGTSTSSYIAIAARTTNKIGMEVLNTSVQVNASSTATYSTNQRLKIAMTYKLNDFKLYVNGILQATDTIGTVPAKAEVYLGSYGNGAFQAMDGINLALIFKTALTDTECINLTTL
jgi:hypothetical protein